MTAATVVLVGDTQRAFAKRLIDRAPLGFVVTVNEPTRTHAQNDRLWAMLTDVSRAKPNGRKATPEVWKCLFMQALGHESRFEMGLDDKPFPIGFRSSRLNKREMSDLTSFIDAWGTQNGVTWSEPQEMAA